MSEEVEPYYGRVVTPRRAQEFRWSDGGLPRIFDPALAAAPPDTDVVRAMFEGLTDYDPRNLAPVSAVATRWESSPDGRHWTFYLRPDARWSNGDPVTAQDFVRSWQRIRQLGERAPHARLLENIEGARRRGESKEFSADAPPAPEQQQQESGSVSPPAKPQAKESLTPPDGGATFGAEAVGQHVLRVRLQRPDRNFPALVAHPVFRPVHELSTKNDADVSSSEGSGGHGPEEQPAPGVVSNGAFRLTDRASDGVVLERDGNYWDSKAVALDRVRFVAARDAEEALAAYRGGAVDAVTNAAFEPLALKLLAPYKDFRRVTYGALTYYSFNMTRAPFTDRRVREALTIALDRDRLSADTMEGITEPARRFIPVPSTGDQTTGARKRTAHALVHDVERARRLLSEAGFPGGANFPRIRLLINRNEQHRTVALAVAEMWRTALGVETDVDMRGWDDYEAALRAGDYDLARRSVVMQTMDEEATILAIFDQPARTSGEDVGELGEASPEATAEPSPVVREAQSGATEVQQTADISAPRQILTEEQALLELPAIPVYFASSYALVKPYVSGFDANLLDAPSLKRVRIDTSWKPPKQAE